MDATLEEATLNLRASLKQWYTEAKPQAAAWRHDHLNGLAKALASDNDTSMYSEKKSLIQIKKQRQQHRRIGKALKTNKAGAATKVFYTDSDGNRHECFQQEQMEDACISKGDGRFSQSYDTPPLKQPLINDLKLIPSAEIVEKILYGLYEIPHNTDYYAAKLLKAL